MQRSQILTATLALLSSQLIAQEQKLSSSIAFEAIQNAKYLEAIDLLDKFISGEEEIVTEGVTKDQLLYHKANALMLLEKYNLAENAAQSLIDSYPESDFTIKASFLIAKTYTKRMQYEKAMEIYHNQATRLFSQDRKQEVAKELIKFAEIFTTPKDPNDLDSPVPHYNKAYLLYKEVLDLDCGSSLHQEAHLQMIEMMRKISNHKEVEILCLSYIEKYDPTWRGKIGSVERVTFQKNLKATSKGKNTALTRYHFAEALHRQDKRRQADAYLLELTRQLEDEGAEENKELIADATWLRIHALTEKGGRAKDIVEWKKATTEYLNKFADHKHADSTALLLAKKLQVHEKKDEAITNYKNYISDIYKTRQQDQDGALSEEEKKQREARIELAHSRIGKIASSKNDFKLARDYWSQVLEKFPNGVLWAETQKLLAELDYNQLVYEVNNYDKEDDYLTIATSSIEKISSYVAKHPLDPRIVNLLFVQGRIPHTLAEKASSVDNPNSSSKEALYELAIKSWSELHSKYPNKPESNKSYFLIAELYVNELFDLEKAISYYKKSTTPEAKQSLQKLKAKHLFAETEKTFSTSETPSIELNTRNIKKVKVHQYWLDVESYFLKSGTLSQATALDVDLVKPDKTWEVDIKDFKKHQLKNSLLPIPFPDGKPGVCVVKIESEDFVTTTLVQRSDLDLALRSSGNELIAYCKNSNKNIPARDVKLIISENEKILHTGTTDVNGVFHTKLDTLKDLSRYNVLAVSANGAAIANQSLNNVQLAEPVKSKAWLFTTNHDIRKGDIVTINGVIRDNQKGSYVFPDHKDYKLIIKAGDTTIQESEVTLTDEGSFGKEFKVPNRIKSNTIQYQLVSTDKNGSTFTHSSSITEEAVSKGKIVAEIAKSSIGLGEKVECEFTATYHWGSPIANRQLKVTLPTGNHQYLVTDSEGKASLEYDTTGIASGSVINFSASFDSIKTTTGTAIATIDPLDLVILAEGDKQTMTAGDSIEVIINTTNHKQEKISSELTLKVIKTNRLENLKLFEGNSSALDETQLIQEFKVTTDPETGRIVQNIKIKKGGLYQLKIEGLDSDDKPSFTQTNIEVLDEDSSHDLALYHQNGIIYDDSSAKLELHSTLKKNTKAIMTIETDHIVKYSLIDVAPGMNQLSIPLEASYAPMFRCHIIAISDRTFSSCEDVVAITKKLHVTSELVGLNDGKAKAGNTIKAKVTVKDSSGNILPAVLYTTLNASSKSNANKDPYVYSPFVRNPGVQHFNMSTSCGFKHHGHQSPILLALKEEAQRQSGAQLHVHQLLAKSKEERISELLESAAKNRNLNNSTEAIKDLNAILAFDPYNIAANEKLNVIGNSQAFMTMNVQHSFNSPIGNGIANGTVRQVSNFNTTSNIANSGNVFNTPVSGLRSGDTAIAPDSIDFFLNNPTRTSQINQSLFNSSSMNCFAIHSNKDNLVEVNFRSSPLAGFSSNFSSISDIESQLISSNSGSLPVWQHKTLVIKDAQEIEIDLPEQAGNWLLEFDALGEEGRAGKSEHLINTISDYTVTFNNERHVIEGDKFKPGITVFRTEAKDSATFSVAVKTSFDDKEHSSKSFELKFEEGESQKLIELDELTIPDSNILKITTTGKGANAEHIIPIRPWGAFKSSSLTQTIQAGLSKEWNLSLPEGATSKFIDLRITPQFDQKLIQLATSPSPSPLGIYTPCDEEHPAGKLLSLTAVLDYLKRNNAADSDSYKNAYQQAEWSFNELISSMREDGSWSLVQYRKNSNLSVTATAYEAIKKWEKFNDTKNTSCPSTSAWLKKQGNSIHEKTCMAQMALSTNGKADFSLCNRLFRERGKLNPAAKVFLAQAFINLERPENAKLLVDEAIVIEAVNRKGSLSFISRNSHYVNGRLLSVLAQLKIQSTKAKEIYHQLMESTSSHLVHNDLLRGSIIQGLADSADIIAAKKMLQAKGSGEVYLNGDLQFSFDIAKPNTFSAKQITTTNSKKNALKVNFKGQGELFISSSLSGITKGFNNKETEENSKFAVVKREFLHPSISFKGKPLYSYSNTKATTVEQGEKVHVTIGVKNKIYRNKELVIVEPIPAGFSYVPSSLSGEHNGARVEDGNLVITLEDSSTTSYFRYQLLADQAGDWRQKPTLFASLSNLDDIQYGEPSSLTISPRGIKTTDIYKKSRYELQKLIKFQFEDKNYQEVEKLYAEYTEQYDEIFSTDVAKAILFTEATKDKPNGKNIIDSFEYLDSNSSKVNIPFNVILKVGAAYAELEEHERAYLVFAAAVSASFTQDSYVSVSLEDQGKLLDSIDYLKKLWYHYPNNNSVNTAWFAMAQNLFDQATSASLLTPRSSNKPSDKITSEAVYKESIEMMNHFLNFNSQHPSADEASYTIANALFALNDYPAVAAQAIQSYQRYPESSLVNSFRYMEALGSFWQRKYESAIKAASIVAEGDSEDKDLASFITAQIFHAQRKPQDAMKWYKKIESSYPDAKESIQYFENKKINFEEITILSPKEKASMTLNYRNISNAELKIYRVDLMKLYLKQKNLSNITEINLAGIAPEYTLNIPLQNANITQDEEKKIDLPLKEEGAYLVICRGDYLYSSGMVMITPLKMEVQEFPEASRLRVNVKDRSTGELLDKVHVKAIGSSNDGFVDGDTDLRGVWSTENIYGTPTVIARDKKGRYAFYRGKTPYVAASNQPNALQQQLQEKKVDYKENLNHMQHNIRDKNWGSYDTQRRAKGKSKGIDVNEVLKSQ